MNKEKFRRYEMVREAGNTNMMNIGAGCDKTGLSRKEYFDIMENYDKYHKEFLEPKKEVINLPVPEPKAEQSIEGIMIPPDFFLWSLQNAKPRKILMKLINMYYKVRGQ